MAERQAGKRNSSASFAEPIIETNIDKLVEVVKGRGHAGFSELGKQLGWSSVSVERVGKVLQDNGIVKLEYPAVGSPRMVFVKELRQEQRLVSKKRILDSYSFEADFVPAKVTVFESALEKRSEYEVRIPRLGAYTALFLDSLKESIARKIPPELTEIADIAKNKELKEKFLEIARQELLNYLSEVEKDVLDVLAGNLMHSMYGLGPIELLMADSFLEEVAINSSKTPVTVYHQKFGWVKSNITIEKEDEIANFASQIGRKVGREITNLNPILDAHLTTGDRVNATLFPVSSFGNTITIRRFARKPWTIINFVESKTLSIDIAAFLWQAVQFELSILVAGGTASGKTAMLNVLAALIPSYHRTISIEDVREIMLPDYLKWNWVPLTTRNPNPEGLGEITMLELMQSSLRMRPDRLILGEIRRQKEAEVLFEALHTGHSVYSTLHADSARQTLRRLMEPPISIPSLEVEAIDLLVTQFRDRRTNKRRTLEVAEIESGASEGQLSLNTVFRWKPREDSWSAENASSKVVQQLNLHTGMTSKEIKDDLSEKLSVLKLMLKNQLNTVNQVGKVMQLYYSSPDSLMVDLKEGKSLKEMGE